MERWVPVLLVLAGVTAYVCALLFG